MIVQTGKDIMMNGMRCALSRSGRRWSAVSSTSTLGQAAISTTDPNASAAVGAMYNSNSNSETSTHTSRPATHNVYGFKLSTIAQPKTEEEYMSEDFYDCVRGAIDEASTIPVEVYKDRTFLDLEKTRVFERAWTCVALTSQLSEPGDVYVTEVGTQPIILTRTKKGDLKAFKNVCRHRGNKLCEKSGKYPVLLCKYHRWGFNLDGRLMATPMFDPKDPAKAKEMMDTSHMKDFNKKDYGLFEVPFDTMGNLIFVNIDGGAPPLRQYFGDVHDQLAEHHETTADYKEFVSARSSTYEVNANWKLLQENFMEYYHLPSVHPSLCAVSGVDEHQRRQGPGSYVGFVTEPLSNGGTPLDPDQLPSMPSLTEKNLETAYFHTLFPNVFYFLLPHSMFTVILKPHPTDPTKTTEFADLSVHKSVLEMPDADERIQKMWDFYDLTNREDIEVCEGVQNGIRVHEYRNGRMSFRFEETIHRFENMIADYMTDNPRIPPGDDTSPAGSPRRIHADFENVNAQSTPNPAYDQTNTLTG